MSLTEESHEMVDLIETAMDRDLDALVDAVNARPDVTKDELALMAQLAAFMVSDLAKCRGVSRDVVLAGLHRELDEVGP